MSGRPLDVLEAAVGDDVEVRLKSGETYRGTLAGYDQHMNLVLDDVVASPGDGTAGPSGAEDAGAAANADEDAAGADEAATSEVDGGTEETGDSAAETPADGRDTTIIRGDNVVSITP